jgi:ABC-type amino acid transport substrate-binding protein
VERLKEFIKILPILFLSLVSFAKDELRIGGENICPYQCQVDKNNPHQGYILDILKAFLALEGKTLKTVSLPFPRQFFTLKNNRADFILVDSNRIKTEKDIQVINVPLGIFSFGLAVNIFNDTYYVDICDLKGKKFFYLSRIFASHHMEKEVKKLGPEATDLGGEDIYPRMLKILSLDRAEAIGGDYYSLSYALLNSEYKENIKVIPTSFLGHAPLMLAVSSQFKEPKRFELKFKKFLEKLRKSGKLKEILANYGMRDWNYRVAR